MWTARFWKEIIIGAMDLQSRYWTSREAWYIKLIRTPTNIHCLMKLQLRFSMKNHGSINSKYKIIRIEKERERVLTKDAGEWWYTFVFMCNIFSLLLCRFPSDNISLTKCFNKFIYFSCSVNDVVGHFEKENDCCTTLVLVCVSRIIPKVMN